MLEPRARPLATSPLDEAQEQDCELPPDHVAVSAAVWDGGEAHAARDTLIEETPVALVYNGISHAVMLTPPSDLEDFAYGFSLTEGIEVRIELATERFAHLKLRRRSLAGRTGCGLCGVDSLAAAMRPVAPLAHRFALSRRALARALDELNHDQPLHRLTGGAHAAAWVACDGEVLLVREDVGRHNALDKLIGALLRWGGDPQAGFVVVTSRASYEMVHKTASAGIGALVAVSAPTAHAVRLADSAGLTLVGFARGHRCTAYTLPENLVD
ncbi:MAG: formate dehydrogenase accessory sulfurtransferase FdhD [Proteobacteria bacterium]|nr:formate dehydrogenase accessory sulfurtransferase FdhD [Pseudomonadota bacterium]